MTAMDEKLERLNREMDKWSGYAATLESEGKQFTTEFEFVRARFLDAITARTEYIATLPAQPTAPPPSVAATSATAVPSGFREWEPAVPGGSPSQEPPRNRRRNRDAKKKRVELCDVRHIWGVDKCIRCGAPHPDTLRPQRKKEPDPAIAAYRKERKRRKKSLTATPGVPLRRPSIWVSERMRMQAVWEAQ